MDSVKTTMQFTSRQGVRAGAFVGKNQPVPLLLAKAHTPKNDDYDKMQNTGRHRPGEFYQSLLSQPSAHKNRIKTRFKCASSKRDSRLSAKSWQNGWFSTRLWTYKEPSWTCKHLLNNMWIDCTAELNPAAARIFKSWPNRRNCFEWSYCLTYFQHPDLGIESVWLNILKLWVYVEKTNTSFKKKKLYAKHYEHKDPQQPKILSASWNFQNVDPLFNKVFKNDFRNSKNYFQDPSFMYRGRPWKMDHKTSHF